MPTTALKPMPIIPVLPAYQRKSDGKTEPRDVVVTLNRAVYIERRFLRGEGIVFRWRKHRWSAMGW